MRTLQSKKGKRVRFRAPKDVVERGGREFSYGTIVDEVWAVPEDNEAPPREPDHDHDWGDYAFFSQLIRWDGDDSYSIRLGYYRRAAGTDVWRFAGQTTIVTEWPVLKPLLEKTLAKKHWFSDEPEKQASAAKA